MFKSITFKNIITDQEIQIPLKKGVNLIVGAKGGGKSSLLELLAGSTLNLVSQKIKSIYKGTPEKPFVFQELTYDSGEVLNASSLRALSSSETKNKFDSCINIIGQNDKTKSDLTNSEQIEKIKKNNALKIVGSNEKYRDLLLQIEQLKRSFSNISNLYDKKIFWDHAFQDKFVEHRDNILISLNFDSTSTIYNLNKEKNILSDVIDEYENQIVQNSNNLQEFKRQINLSSQEKIQLDKSFANIKLELEKIIKLFMQKKSKIEKYTKVIKMFQKKYDLVIDELKKSDDENNKFKSFLMQAESHMVQMAKNFKDVKNTFNSIFNKEVKIENNFTQEDNLLTYKLMDDVVFTEDEKIKLLGSLLYSSNTTTEPIKWLNQFLSKGLKQSNNETYNKVLAKIIKDKIKVFANQKEYKNMSPGEKSIFGIKYKLANSKEQMVFLDQPEDNLDNHTVAHEMLGLIKNNQAEQIILVTHNANIGILSNPTNVIVADIENPNAPYMVGNIPDIKDNPQAFYLEGGSSYLKSRYEIICENKGDENVN